MEITAEIMNKNLDEIPECVSEELTKMGVPMNIQGFNYLGTAITMVAKDPTLVGSMTKRLYPDVAKAYCTTAFRVERTIRHAVEISFERGNADYLYSLFSSTISSYKGKATNSEFIARVARKLRKQVIS